MKYFLILLLAATGAHAEVRYDLDNLTDTEEHIRPFINDVFQAYCYGLDAQRTQIYPYLVKYWTYLRAFDTRPYDFCISYIRIIKTRAASACTSPKKTDTEIWLTVTVSGLIRTLHFVQGRNPA
jgi:hypothetical protein